MRAHWIAVGHYKVECNWATICMQRSLELAATFGQWDESSTQITNKQVISVHFNYKAMRKQDTNLRTLKSVEG